MENELKKKYGLFTAMAMVIGIVIGSGIFFKAEAIHNITGGDMTIGILAWIIGGLVMIICSVAFSFMATKYEKVNGIVDYAEAAVGSRYAYFIGWFLSVIYYPTLTSVLAWLSARYTMVLFGSTDITGGTCMTLACLFLVAIYALNALSPILAGKFQVSSTTIKLIPLILMAIVGTIVGVSNGQITENFSQIVEPVASKSIALFSAVVATSFAYEGWIIATSINAELHNAKKNLPIALTGGALIVVIVYILYYIGLSGAVSNSEIMANGAQGVSLAFTGIFGAIAGKLLTAFIVISCLGTLNGLMLGCTRGMYSIAVRNLGPSPSVFKQLDPKTNMATNSSMLGVLLSAIWLFFFYGSNLTEVPLFGKFSFDSSELPIITIYLLYIPIFIMYMLKAKEMNAFKRFIMPLIALVASAFMVYAAYYAHGERVWYYLIIFATVMIIGAFFMKPKQILED